MYAQKLNCRAHFLSALHSPWFKNRNMSRIPDIFWAPWQNSKKEKSYSIYFFPESPEVFSFLPLSWLLHWKDKFSPPPTSPEAFHLVLQTIRSKLRPRIGCCTPSNLNFTRDFSFSLTCPRSNPRYGYTHALFFHSMLHDYLFCHVSCLPATSHTLCCQSDTS